MDKQHFNEQLRDRTLNMATGIHNLLNSKKLHLIDRALIQQLLRSSSSVAANYRAATRGRSDAEFYSKICIVVEECDETQFWLDYLVKIKILTETESECMRDEVDQLLRIMTAIKKKMKDRLGKQNPK